MESISQNYSQPNKLLQFKLDFSCMEHTLNNKFIQIANKLQNLEQKHHELSQKCQTSQIDLDGQLEQIIGRMNNNQSQQSSLADQISKLSQSMKTNINQSLKIPFKNQQVNIQQSKIIPKIEQKTPTQVLDLIDQRINVAIKEKDNNLREIQMNTSPQNSDRVCYTVKVRQTPTPRSDRLTLQIIDQKCYTIYAKIMQQLDASIAKTRSNLKQQLKQLSNTPKISTSKQNKPSIKKISSKRSIKDELTNTQQKSNKIINPPSKSIVNQQNKSQQNKTIVQQSKNNQNNDKNDSNQTKLNQQITNIELSEHNLRQFIQEQSSNLRKQLLGIINKNKEQSQQKYQQSTNLYSNFADKILEVKKSIQEISNQVDALKIQAGSSQQKSSGAQRQLSILLQQNTDQKARIRSLQGQCSNINGEISKIKTQLNKMSESQQNNGDNKKDTPNGSQRDLFRDSKSSFRESVLGNAGLNPIRNSSIIKQNNVRLDSTQQNVRVMAHKLATLIDRVNKMQDQRKKFGQSFSGMLPKINQDSSKSSSANHFQIIREQIKKVNNDIMKTNQKLQNTKQKLDNLYEQHSTIPNKIEDLYMKLRQYNQLQQDRLIELIKQLINRMLSDPFDNHFTNRLKRQINVKFLQIRHEYHTILKQIQNKVEDRAQKSDIAKTTQRLQENIAELKALNIKKCDTQDFRKGIKYLEGKVKQTYQYAKDQVTSLRKDQKQYIGVKKQNFC